MSDVYYKIFVGSDGLSVVCLQEHDERDYDQTKFLSRVKFESESDAQDMIRDIYAYVGRYVVLT